ncbi:MAG: lantibiotic ABC transporter [Dictyoglomus sp. NZ13-RE01]|nr:MAG: lantibiotic ABC transporter [Dictyoglomus sp. NZ13-RE01]
MKSEKVLLRQAVYYAPRGEARLVLLGNIISHNYLSPFDKLIGIIGSAGSGKSLLIRGLFPGLNLTNDDEGIYRRPLPLLEDYERNVFRDYIYHVDVRFELAFVSIYILAEAIKRALEKDRKVVVEHFEVIYPYLKRNADILIGIGEEVIIVRPNIFGPEPQEIADIVFKSLEFRLKAHTAEDLTGIVLEDYGYSRLIEAHSDVIHGFVIFLKEKPHIEIDLIEQEVRKYISMNLPVSYYDSQHIKIGDKIIKCTGPRLHVESTGKIDEFVLYPEYIYSPIDDCFLLVGFVSMEEYNKVLKILKEKG